MTPSFIVSIDLGQANDFTAVAIGEIVAGDPYAVQIRHLQRFKLHTPYPEMVDAIGDLTKRVRDLGRTIMTVDATGVGRPVVDLFKKANLGVVIWPVTIATSAMGQARRDEYGMWTCPKKDLIGALVALAHGGQLAVSDRLPDAAVFKEELRNFRMKITADANLTYGAWRDGVHDDLVLAVALVAWAAQRWASPGGLM